MKVKLSFEPHESMPPALWGQVKRAISVSIEQYGLSAHVEEDRSAELEAYQRYWQWQRQLAEEFPATPADSEVK